MEGKKHLEHNQKKLDATPDIVNEWIKALNQCKEYVTTKLGKRTLFGAHTEQRLVAEPVEHYVGFAYEAILEGDWEWKDGRTLGQQLIRIADNRIGKEVEKYRLEKSKASSILVDDVNQMFYSDDPLAEQQSLLEEIVFKQKIDTIESAIIGNENLEMFWECVKGGMKREAIAEFMEKSPKQVDKIREKLINKIKNAPHFQVG